MVNPKEVIGHKRTLLLHNAPKKAGAEFYISVLKAKKILENQRYLFEHVHLR